MTIGAFQVGPYQLAYQQGSVVVAPPPAPSISGLGGSKPKKIRGPYSDPLVYEAYIARCIAEREAPRVNVEIAIIKEALVQEVEQRLEYDYTEVDALIRENQLLQRLLALESANRDLEAIETRQDQIMSQIE